MRKYTRTANLTILETYLIGGQIDYYGNYCDGFDTFNTYNENDLKDENGNFSIDLIKESVINLINLSDDFPLFNYYNEQYRFKVPSEKNLNILVNRIKNKLIEQEA